MAAKRYRPLLMATLFAVGFYIINRLLFLLPQFTSDYAAYYHSLEVLYLFFWACCMVILLMLLRVHGKTPDNTGYVYMGATLVQMGLSYAMLKPILNSAIEGHNFEKTNFFIIFILFLAIETLITIRLLNNKQ
jgi:hypothetical protein